MTPDILSMRVDYLERRSRAQYRIEFWHDKDPSSAVDEKLGRVAQPDVESNRRLPPKVGGCHD